MAYITSTVTSANPSADLYTAVASALTTAGYTLVDTVVISTRTHKIWKSAAANNSAGLDWYLDVAYTTTGNGNMWFVPMEYFDPATDLAYRMTCASSNAGVDATYYSRFGATGYSLENGNWDGNLTPLYSNYSLDVTTSTFGYWISITGTRVIALTSVTPHVVVYAGMYTPSTPHATAAGASLFPLIRARMSTGASVTGSSAVDRAVAVSRVPKATTVNSWYSLPTLVFGGVGVTPQIPTATLTVNSSYQLNPYSIYLDPGAVPAGGWLGTLMDVGTSYATGTARGDTITISGATWILSTTSSSYVIGFKAA